MHSTAQHSTAQHSTAQHSTAQHSTAQILIINLEKSIDRKNFITQQFSTLPEQIPFEFFSAIYGKENPDFPLFKKYNSQKRIERKGYDASLSQLGCWASHYLIREKCVTENRAFIVLEDDAILQENFLDAYKFIQSDSNQFEFFWLSPPSGGLHKEIKIRKQISDKNRISQFYKGWANTTGYFITPRAAQKFLMQSQEWIYNVDITMDRFWENKVDFCAFIPACVKPNFQFESNIPFDEASKKRRTLIVRLRREYYKFKDNLNKVIYIMQNKNK